MDEFLKLFGFGCWSGVDYDADVNPEVNFDVIELAGQAPHNTTGYRRTGL